MKKNLFIGEASGLIMHGMSIGTGVKPKKIEDYDISKINWLSRPIICKSSSKKNK